MCVITMKPNEFTPTEESVRHNIPFDLLPIRILSTETVSAVVSSTRYANYQFVRLSCSSCTRHATWTGKKGKIPPVENVFVCAFCEKEDGLLMSHEIPKEILEKEQKRNGLSWIGRAKRWIFFQAGNGYKVPGNWQKNWATH